MISAMPPCFFWTPFICLILSVLQKSSGTRSDVALWADMQINKLHQTGNLPPFAADRHATPTYTAVGYFYPEHQRRRCRRHDIVGFDVSPHLGRVCRGRRRRTAGRPGHLWKLYSDPQWQTVAHGRRDPSVRILILRGDAEAPVTGRAMPSMWSRITHLTCAFFNNRGYFRDPMG